jgi:monoterpene epsilon-lactone hydrolase
VEASLMASKEHDDLVASLIAAETRTPDVLPTRDEIAAMRQAEIAGSSATTGSGMPVALSLEDDELGGVPVLRVDAAESEGSRTLVYFHGGGYLWMTPHSHVAVLASLASSCRAHVVGVHYRRAPEAAFPAAVEDARRVYRALLEGGASPGQVLFAGDSAGGGLALAAMLAVRDEGMPLPAGGVVFSPWTDLAVTGESADTADDPIVGGVALRAMADGYLQGADPRSPLASPLYGDLEGLPPLLIQVGTREALRDDAARFADRAAQSSVEVTYVEHGGVIHMWIVFGPELPESRRAFALAGAFASQLFT